MTEEVKVDETQGSCGSCGCGGGSCATHQSDDSAPAEESKDSGLMSTLSAHRGTEEMALAFLLAITPLVVLTFFGQAGLL